MKRLKRIISSVFIMIFAFSATCFAATNTYTEQQLGTIKSDLKASNIDDKYSTAIINHLTVNPIDQKGADELVKEINSFEAMTESKATIDDYTMDELTNMYSEAKLVASHFGLRLSMNGSIPTKKNQVATTKITIYDDNGAVVDETTLRDIKKIKKDVNLDSLKSAVKNAVLKGEVPSNGNENENTNNGSGSATGTANGNSGNKNNGTGAVSGNRKPVMSTSMKKTGTNNGNLLLAGSALVALAGGVAVYSRKRKMA